MKTLVGVLRRLPGTRSLTRDRSSDAPSSCAQLAIHLAKVEDETLCSTQLGELLRVVDLLRHPSVSVQAFHRLLDKDTELCPLQEWCSFCDGGSRDVRIRLTWGGNPSGLQTAMLEWTDSKATPQFRRLQELVKELGAQRIPAASARHLAPIQLSICFTGDAWMDGVEHCRRLQDLVDREAMTGNRKFPRFRVSFQPPEHVEAKALAFSGPVGIPIQVDHDYLSWSWVLGPRSPDNTTTDVWDAGSAILTVGNVISLRAELEDDQTAQKLHEILRSHTTALRSLQVIYDNLYVRVRGSSLQDNRQQQVQGIADALFSRDSKLQLNTLTLTARIKQEDLLVMIARLASSSFSGGLSSGNRRRELVCDRWDWSNMRGATLAELLKLVGGVKSLCFRSYSSDNYISQVPIDEIPNLVHGCPSLERLDAFVTCTKPLLIYASKCFSPVAREHVDTLDYDVSSSDRVLMQPTSLQHLHLRPVDRDVAVVQHSIERLLQHVGQSLVGLALSPHRGRVQFDGAMAAAIAHLCPNLEKLSVQCVDAAFASGLVNALANSSSCRLQQLELGSHDADAMTFAALFESLRVPTHPLTRSLRSLRLHAGDVDALLSPSRDVLAANDRLQDLSLCGDVAWILEHQEPSENDQSSFALIFPPLRHRLAVLSVLGRFVQLRGVAMTVLEMMARRVRRLRLVQVEPEYEYDSEEE